MVTKAGGIGLLPVGLKVDCELLSFYDGYFTEDTFQNRKHELTADDSLNAIVSLAGDQLGSVLDVGAARSAIVSIFGRHAPIS